MADGSPTMWRVRGKISGRAPSSGRKQKLEVRRTRRAGCTDGTKIVDVDTAPNLTHWPVEHGLLSHKRAEYTLIKFCFRSEMTTWICLNYTWRRDPKRTTPSKAIAKQRGMAAKGAFLCVN